MRTLGGMEVSSLRPSDPRVDELLLALGQAVYAGQVLEETMVEVISVAMELVEGTGTGEQFAISLDRYSKRTLGQVVLSLKKIAHLPAEEDQCLADALDARNFVIHKFSAHAGDIFQPGADLVAHRSTLHEKCRCILEGTTVATDIHQCLVRMNSERTAATVSKLRATANDLRRLLLADKSTEH